MYCIYMYLYMYLGATANEITSVNRMYMHVYRCTVGLFYIHVHVGPRRIGSLHVLYIHVHCTNVPVHVPCTGCILAESVRVTPVLTDPVAVEVVAQAAVCEPGSPSSGGGSTGGWGSDSCHLTTTGSWSSRI